MRIVCVDDEILIVNLTVRLCKELPDVDDVQGFNFAEEALEYIKNNPTDVALLDIDMPKITGLELAAKIKEASPDTAIIFLTGYSEFAVDAFKLHASGYLLKPISKENLTEEIGYVLRDKKLTSSHVYVHTFGDFGLFVDGKAVSFSRNKAKEILAYLVDRQGVAITRSGIFTALWEDGMYDRSKQKELDVIIRSLKTTLDDNGVGDIIEMRSGTLRVCPEKIDCDMYRFLKGDSDAINSYRGEYMNTYLWAMPMESYLERRLSSL